MTTKTPRTGPAKPTPPPGPDPVDPDVVDEDQADDEQPPEDAPKLPEREESKAERARRLRAELAELERNDSGVEAPEPTHVLQLANGDLVETASPGATHHGTEEGGVSYPVIGRFPLIREEV